MIPPFCLRSKAFGVIVSIPNMNPLKWKGKLRCAETKTPGNVPLGVRYRDARARESEKKNPPYRTLG